MTEPPYVSEYQAGYIHKPGAQGVVQVSRWSDEDGIATGPLHERQPDAWLDENGVPHVKPHPTWLLPAETHAAIHAAEERVTDPETGGMKGKKLATFSSIPSDVLWELAEHFGAGERKYPNDPETGQPNWQKGYDWRLNVDALSRHLHLWLQGEDTDPETGSNHLVAVIWHAMVLRYFQIHKRGRDFR